MRFQIEISIFYVYVYVYGAFPYYGLFLRQGLSMTSELPKSSYLYLANLLHKSSVLSFQALELQVALMPTQLYMWSGDLNSSPHAFEASVGYTETSLKPSF